MKLLYLLVLISYHSFAQQSLPYEPRTYQYEDSEAQKVEDYMRKHLKSPQNNDTPSKMSFQEKMNTLNDTKFNFEEYNVKPEEVYKELPSGKLEPLGNNSLATTAITDNKTEKDSDTTKIIVFIFGLFCVFFTFITLFSFKRAKRF